MVFLILLWAHILRPNLSELAIPIWGSIEEEEEEEEEEAEKEEEEEKKISLDYWE
jgi:hypothetical protein